MNIDKIKNYNQKMLALFSTIVVLMAAIGLISFLGFIISDLWPSKPIVETNVLLADEQVERFGRDSLRQQIISYEEPRLVDTACLVYLIPVALRTLENPEYYGEGVDELLDKFSSGSSRKIRVKQFYGSFINLIVYDYKNSKTWNVCDARVMGKNLAVVYYDDEILAVFEASEKDTDKDGKITLADFTNLNVYSFKESRLKRVGKDDMTVLSYKFVEGTKDLLILFGIDRNKDGKFNSATEPIQVFKYNYSTGSLANVIDSATQKEIQRIIDKK